MVYVVSGLHALRCVGCVAVYLRTDADSSVRMVVLIINRKM
jgi:hypothetical protein